MSKPIKSFSFHAGAVGAHLGVTVRFGAEGQRAILGELVMAEADWLALALCAGIEGEQDEIVLVPPGQFCPAGLISAGLDPDVGGKRRCPECGDMIRVRGDSMLSAHEWPHRWSVPE